MPQSEVNGAKNDSPGIRAVCFFAGFGPVNGTESMVCDNANNPGAQFEFGGTISGKSDTISGRFYYWGDDSITFAGKCVSATSCQATGSNAFVITLSKP